MPKINVSEDEAEDYYNEHLSNYKKGIPRKSRADSCSWFSNGKKNRSTIKCRRKISPRSPLRYPSPGSSPRGDLGFITRQNNADPLDKTIFNLPLNKDKSDRQSSYGFQFFKVLEFNRQELEILSDIKEEVIADIRSQKEDQLLWTAWSIKDEAVIKKESNMRGKKSISKI